MSLDGLMEKGFVTTNLDTLINYTRSLIMAVSAARQKSTGMSRC